MVFLVSDPWRVYQEAAADYVGHKVANWVLSLSMLSFLATSSNIVSSDLVKTLRKTRENYNKSMSLKVFGYQMYGGLMGYNANQVETVTSIPDRLREFLDKEILESRIPNDFDQVVAFKPLIQEIMSRFSYKKFPK